MTVRIEQSGGRGRFFVDNVEGYNVDTGGNLEVAGQLSAGSVNLTGSLATSELNTNSIDGSSNLVFQRSNSEKMRLTSDGKLGIGNANPSEMLDVAGTGFFGTGNNIEIADNTGQLRLRGLGYQGHLSVGSQGLNIATNSNARGILFGTGNTERMRITSAGYLKVDPAGTYNGVNEAFHEFSNNVEKATLKVTNTSNIDSINARTYESVLANNLTSQRHFLALTNGALVYNILSGGNVQNLNNSYSGLSDLKLKENIADASPKLEDINKVRFVNFDFKEGSNIRQFGVIAQELEEIFPALVESTPDTEEVEVTDEEGNVTTETRETGEVTKAVKYSVLTLMAVKALQEADAKIDALEARLAALEAK